MWIFSDKSIPVKERVLTYVEKIIDFLSEYPQMSMFIIKEISINPELFREKVMSLKKDKTSNLLAALKEGIENDEIASIEPIVFMINLHSLCAYPFLASPIFKAIVNSNEMDWEDAQNQKLKQSVKEFVEFKLSKNTN
jgi:TetR/AcrR family transcriptional regulator